MLQEIWPLLGAKGQLVNLVAVGKQTKFEDLNVFQQDKHRRWNMSSFKVRLLLHSDVF